MTDQAPPQWCMDAAEEIDELAMTGRVCTITAEANIIASHAPAAQPDAAPLVEALDIILEDLTDEANISYGDWKIRENRCADLIRKTLTAYRAASAKGEVK